MSTPTEINLPCEYTLKLDGVCVSIRRNGERLQPFSEGDHAGALPTDVSVKLRDGETITTEEFGEKDFAEDIRISHSDETASVSGCHRGLRIVQELRWKVVNVGPRALLCVSRRAGIHIEDIRFANSDHLWLFARTHWANLVENKSYELSTNMGWHHHRSFRENGAWRYFAWNTPYMFNFDGPASPHEGYMGTDAHTMGMAEYTAMSWPAERYAVMVAIDPVEYLERNVNAMVGGVAHVGFEGWFEPTDVGAHYETPWQHYYFLEDEDDPLTTTALLWREEFARKLNPYLMPESELEPWFATENLHGPRVGCDYLPTSLWDGNLTALEQHYEALRRDPLDSRIRPLLFHERPGFSTLQPDISRYYHAQELPISWLQFNVPLTHQKGERLTITCGVTLNTHDVDLRWDIGLTGTFFQVAGVAMVRHSPFGALVPDVSPERVQIIQDNDGMRVHIEHSAAALKRDLGELNGYFPFFEIRIDVVEEIPEHEGVVEGTFAYRPTGQPEFVEVPLIRDQDEVRGEFRFPAEPYPVKVHGGTLERGPSHRRVRAYRKNADIFFEVEDGQPVRIAREDFIPRMAQLMRKYDISITCYVASYGMSNYDFLRNPDWLIPNMLALGPDRKPKKIWYLGGNRSDRFCVACKEQNHLLDAAIRELLTLGPFGLYVDEIQGNVGSCHSREHGHTLGQTQRLAHRAGERYRQLAREAGMPHMYVGTEVGGLLQHTFAQGHNFEGTDPSRKDELFEEIKRMALAQIAYGFPGSRAFFNYCFEGAQPNRERTDGIFGHTLGLAFPRFSLAPWTGQPSPIGTYFATSVKRAFKTHYRYGQTQIPRELVLPGSNPETLTLVLESDAGYSVHFANLSGAAVTLEQDGYAAELEHGHALLVDSFGNAMGLTREVRLNGEPYLGFDRPVAFGLWRLDDQVFLRILEPDRTTLNEPIRVFLAPALLDRLGQDSTQSWQALDKMSAPSPVSCTPASNGLELVYPSDPTCRCLAACRT